MVVLAFTLVLALGQTPSVVSPAAPPPGTLVDRIVAVVDDDPVLWSEVLRVIRLGLLPLAAGADGRPLERRALDALIEQRLRQHEVARFDTEGVSAAEVERQIAAIAERNGGDPALDQLLAELSLGREGLRQLVAEQLRVLAFVEERLGARVFVDLDDIRSYYEGELLPRLRSEAPPGEEPPLPPLVDVQESIRLVLYQRRLNQELALWTQQLRRAADVVDLLERSGGQLPLRFSISSGANRRP